MNTAVILAAGMGTRLREAHADMPKGFLGAWRPAHHRAFDHAARAGGHKRYRDRHRLRCGVLPQAGGKL